MFEYYDAASTLREGLVLLDPAGRVQLVNDEARELHGAWRSASWSAS